MTIRWPILTTCVLLLLPLTETAAVARSAAVWGVSLPGTLSPAPRMQSAPVGGSGSEVRDGVELVSAGPVVVVPFTNISRDTADDWIGDGIAETVAADLQRLGATVVSGPDQPSGGVAPSSNTTALVAMARAAGARWVVTGGYQHLGDRLRITARLIDGRTGAVADTLTADGTVDDIFTLQDRIVADLAAGPAFGRAWGEEDSGRRVSIAGPTGEGAVEEDAPSFVEGRIPDGGAERAGARVAAPPSNVSGGIVLPDAAPAERRGAGRGVGRGSATPGPARGAPGPASTPGLAASAGVLSGRPSVVATRALEPPSIDGQLDDAIWQGAARITEFVQTSPVEGAPASEDTEVYIAFDSTHLYVGMYAHYSNPGMIRANRVDRDRASFSDDTISFYFDTFLDQQRAFVFTLNGYGVQGDSLMGGGGGGGFRGGPGGTPRGDSSWDVLFDSGGTLVDDGWTAEMAIPFKSLRYPSSDTHRWGFQIARSIRGKDESVVWSPVSRDVSGFMPQMGLLDGLRGLSTSRNLEILPTMTAIQVGSLDTSTGAFPEERQPEGGVNLKYGLTSNLTLDFTYNPDFSQIESDRPQIEVNQRFPLFFSELRPFFLEGQEVFDIRGPVTLIHTRTIVDPRYGAKLTGKVGKTTMGLLFANDEAPGKVDDPTDRAFGVAANTVAGRVRYDLYSESHIGAIMTDREFLDSYSRMVGVDGRFRLNPTTSADFMASSSQNRDLDGNDTSGPMFDLGLRHNGRNLSYSVSGYSLDPEFDTEVGFVRRRDIRRASSNVSYRWWPESWIINWGPSLNYSRNWNFDDILEDEETRLRLNVSFAKNIRFNGDVRREMERFGGIDFFKTRYSVGGNVSTSRLVSFGGSVNWGDQVLFSDAPFLGRGSSGNLFMSLRPLSRLQSQINVNTSRLIDPFDQTEIFNVKIFRASTTYQFTDRLLLRNIMEHNTFSGTLGANLLVTYRVNSGTVFFIGYDDRYRQGDLIFDDDDEPLYFTTDFQRTNRAFFTKISYLFRY